MNVEVFDEQPDDFTFEEDEPIVVSAHEQELDLEIDDSAHKEYLRIVGHRRALDRIEEEVGAEPLRMLTIDELRDRSIGFNWLVKGIGNEFTNLVVGGPGKSLKSYIMSCITVGLASGKPIFGHFTVPRARPVVSFVGEGGEEAYLDRIDRICKLFGVDSSDLPLLNIFEVALIGSKRFDRAIEHALAIPDIGLVTIDPMYAYQGGSVQASNIYERGAFLNQLYAPFKEARTSLYVGDHFNQNGTGFGLHRLSQAGMKEWADSWVLLDHLEPPNVPEGKFTLFMQIGSRRWGESSWSLSLDIGPFDQDTGRHVGAIDFELKPADADSVTSGKGRSSREGGQQQAILEIVSDHEFELTKSEICKAVGGNGVKVREVFSRLVGSFLQSCVIKVPNTAGKLRDKEVWGTHGAAPPT